MKNWLLAAVVVAGLAAGGWWSWGRWQTVTPEDAFLRATASAALGDEDAFVAGFTQDSRPLVAALLALARGDDPKTSTRHPYHWLLTEQIESADVQGDQAWLRVRRPGATQSYDVPMRKVDGGWYIDALAFDAKRRGRAAEEAKP